MTPEELDGIRDQIQIERAGGYPADGECPLWYHGMKCGRRAMLEHIDSQAEQIKRANHRYADLQNICDDQDKEIKRLEDALVEERAAHNFNKTYYMKGGRSWEEICQKEWLKVARQQLHAEGKICNGHVAARRLTDDQRAAISRAIRSLEDPNYHHSVGEAVGAEVLRAMLEEGNP